jgi:CubicO group peptidase (beta-lactamase class C family)
MKPVRNLFVGAVLLANATASAQDIPTDSAIRAIIKPRVDTGRYAGVAVGVVSRDGRQVVTAYGPRAGVTPFDGNTVFEIGSITKTFTTAILADMVARREVALDDPVAKLLPPGMKFPERDGKQITLLDLATQTSGLPRLPGNLEITNPQNPYATYTPAQLANFLASYELPRAIGAQYEYSNLGLGLLGMALSYKGRRDYEVLVAERVLRPLGMSDTKITLTPSMQSRLAPGHDESGRPAGLWDIPTLAGAGALRSTVNDMLKYVRANADSNSKPLGRTLAATHGERRPGAAAGKSDTGIPLVADAWYHARIWAEPGGGTIYGLLIRVDTGAIWYGARTTDLPANGTRMSAYAYGSLSSATGTPIIFHIGSVAMAQRP